MFSSKFAWRVLLSACLVLSALSFNALAEAPDKPATKPQTSPQRSERADLPNPKHDRKNPEEPEAGFVKRHEGFMARKDRLAKHGGTRFLLVGDSITDGWHNGDARDILEENFGKYNPYNIGIGGDRTQHVLWRLDQGEVDGISPKVTMLMIGTNNLGSNTNKEIVAGVTKIVEELKQKLPSTKILLLAIFPRAPATPTRSASASRASTSSFRSSTMAARPSSISISAPSSSIKTRTCPRISCPTRCIRMPRGTRFGPTRSDPRWRI